MSTTIHFETGTCTRCGGTGRMPYAAYGGVCFKCHGQGVVATPAGRSARKLWDELLEAASAEKQAWEVEVGEVVSYARQALKCFRVIEKDFNSRCGAVVDGRCLGSVMLGSRGTNHFITPDSPMKVKPSSETILAIMAEVDKRRKGATLVVTDAEAVAATS